MADSGVSVTVSSLHDEGEKPGYEVEVTFAGSRAVLERSGASFAMLDEKLRKIFPNTKLPALSTTDKRDSEVVTRRSSAEPKSPQKMVAIDDANEWFAELLELPEILTSDILLSFLDSESMDGEMLDFSEEGQSGVDILLSKEALLKKTVLKCHTITYPVKAGDVAVWKFRTKKHDIGFSVDVDGQEVIKYERVNSHEKMVCGLFEVPQGLTQRTKDKSSSTPSSIKIFFDNSFSKLRAKDLRYSCGVFAKAELEEAQDTANKKNEEKKKYIKQRILLQESLQNMAMAKQGRRGHFGVGGTSRSSVSGHSLTALLASQQREEEKEELEKILEEKTSLMGAYQETLLVLQEEKKTAASALQRVETLLEQQGQLEDELLAASAEIETLKERAESAQTHLQSNQEALMEALGHSKSSEEVELLLTRALETKDQELTEVTGDLEEVKLAHRMLEETLAKTASERKTLKQYGKTAKMEIERLKGENAALSEESSAAEKDLSFAKDQLEEAHAEILRLQAADGKREAELRDVKIALEAAESRVRGGMASGADEATATMGSGTEVDTPTSREGEDDNEEENDDLVGDTLDDGWKVGGDVVGALPKDRSTEVGALERRNTKELSPEVYRDGKWHYVPPPRLIKSTSGGFYGF